VSAPSGGGSVDLLGLDMGMGGGGSAGSSGYTGKKLPVATWLTAAAGHGLQITGTFGRAGGAPVLEMTFSNQSPAVLSDFAVQFDKNSFKLANKLPLAVAPLSPGASVSVHMPLGVDGQLGRQDPLNKLNLAFKATGLAAVTCVVARAHCSLVHVCEGIYGELIVVTP
jgi:hypothetical protein